jgi:transposase
VPRVIVPDNAKVAVIKACLYEPQVDRTYAEMAAHYGTAVLPTRPRRPRDEAKVEACVLIVERWLLGRLCGDVARPARSRLALFRFLQFPIYLLPQLLKPLARR